MAQTVGLAGIARQWRRRLHQFAGASGIVPAEIGGFADLGLRIGVGLARLADQQCHEGVALCLDAVSGSLQAGCPVVHRAGSPAVKRLRGLCCGLIDICRGCRMPATHGAEQIGRADDLDGRA